MSARIRLRADYSAVPSSFIRHRVVRDRSPRLVEARRSNQNVASVRVGRPRVISLFLSPVMKYLDEGLKVR